MVSVVPSIIPILTANAVAANQPKKQKKINVSKEKKLKDSPLNDKVNCRVFLNNGNVIEGHYEGNWYEDNSDEEGIWIKTDNGTEEINSKDYDRVEYYHKKPLKEAYIKGENGNVYYTKNNEMFLSMVNDIFISKNIPVRVYFDTIKQLYVFGNAFGYIHADLATSMKYYSKIYGTDEMRANISYLKQNCALFQVLPDDDFKKYDVGDGYTKGRFLILDGLIFACREKEYGKVRDNVPLFNGHIGEWQDVQYYEYKKSQQTVNESVEDNADEKLNSKNNCKIVLKDGKTIYGHLLSVNENYVYINSNNGNRIKKDNIKELYVYYDCEVILKDGRTIYGNFVGDYGDHKLHLDDAFNRKGWAIKDEMIDKVNYKKVIKHTFDTEKLNESANSLHNNKIIDIDGEQKSIYNSRGEKIADTEESLRKFYKWFGNSKAVDSKNRPYVMYHGTYDKFDSFSYQYSGKNDSGFYGKGFYFTYDYGYAKKYGKKIMRVYLKINNPYKMTTDSKENMINYMLKNGHMDKKTASSLLNELNKAGEIVGTSWLEMADKETYRKIARKISEMFSESLIKDGYDGIMTYREYMVFNPNQIKSIKNNGNWSNDTDNINESVEDKILYIIRGVPGSGKSTLAHKLTDNVVEADQYFYDDKGNYNWSADKLNQAHNWCYNTVKKYMEEGRDKIAVANTFVKKRDYKRYVELAEQFGYKVDIRVCNGNFKNIHGVPDETVERMRAKFQLDESALNDKVFYTKQLSRMLNICLNIGNARFIYIPEANLYVIGDAHNNTHISLFISALNEGKFNIGENDIDEYFDEYINSAEDTGAIITKEYANDENVWLKSPDSTNVINDYGKFYLCNGLCIEESLAELTNTKPNYVKRKSYLDESIAYVSKKDLSDIILKNPTRKELKENGLEFCRYMFEDDNTYYFADAKEYCHLDMSQLYLDIFKSYNLHTDGGYYSVKENCFYIRNDFGCEKNKERLDNTKLLHKLFGNFKSIIYEGDYPKKYEYYDKRINESAENDKTLRDYAVKLANICLDALVKTKYETVLAGTQIQINVDKAFKKAVPMLKKSPYNYYILLTNRNNDNHPSYGKTENMKNALISLPIFDDNPTDISYELLMRHKKLVNNIFKQYEGTNELTKKLKELSIKYIKAEIKKQLNNIKPEYENILVHECTHLLDDIRRTKTYKHKEQHSYTDDDPEFYYNTPEEQNAYYQETIQLFDNWAKNKDWKKEWKEFKNFLYEFLRQYRGEWMKLSLKNRKKLKKRAYAYWELYIKE